MPFVSSRAPASTYFGKGRGSLSLLVLCSAATAVTLTLACFGQMSQTPSRAPVPVLSPDVNRPPDANQQMTMREQGVLRRNFDVANARRLKELIQTSQELETMAMALKAELDQSDEPSQNTIRKAETIEKLAHSVKEQMTLSVAPN